MFITNFFLGIIIVIVGVFAVKFNKQITESFPRIDWLERKVGPGTTYYVFQLFSFLVILFGFLMMISLHDNVLEFLLGPVIDLFSV